MADFADPNSKVPGAKVLGIDQIGIPQGSIRAFLLQRLLISFTVLLPLLVCNGCTTGYWRDRASDAGDVFTVTIGMGFGEKLRVGPMKLGFHVIHEMAGVKNGILVLPSRTIAGDFPSMVKPSQRGLNPDGAAISGGGTDIDGFVLPFRVHPDPELGTLFSFEKYPVRGNPGTYDAIISGNHFGDMAYGPIPFVSLLVSSHKNPRHRARYKYYSQIEVSGGYLFAGKVGVNPGELLDLFLGFFGLDIYDDDFEKWKIRASVR